MWSKIKWQIAFYLFCVVAPILILVTSTCAVMGWNDLGKNLALVLLGIAVFFIYLEITTPTPSMMDRPMYMPPKSTEPVLNDWEKEGF